MTGRVDDFEIMRRIGRCAWRTAAGHKMTLADMDCGHLRNVALMLDRKREAAIDEAGGGGGGGGGDMAEMEAGHAMDAAFARAGRLADKAELVAFYVELREARALILEGPK